MAKQALTLFLLILLTGTSQAAIEIYDFSDDSYRLRYKEVGGQLRCPKCENQSIADSNSPSAYDMRQELYRLLEEGKSDSEIFDFMVMRFGDYVLYNPPVRSNTWLLWYFPPALVILGLLLAFFLVRSRQEASPVNQLTDSERQQKIKKILELEQSIKANASSSSSTTKESS